MKTYRLYHFSSDSGEREFVVISSMAGREVLREHEDDNVKCVGSHDMDGNCSGLPTDRPLVRE